MRIIEKDERFAKKMTLAKALKFPARHKNVAATNGVRTIEGGWGYDWAVFTDVTDKPGPYVVRVGDLRTKWWLVGEPEKID